jgi:Tol biopolymer transport system component
VTRAIRIRLRLHRTWRATALALLIAIATAWTPAKPTLAQDQSVPSAAAPLRIVFSAVVRDAAGNPVGHPQIFTINEDSTDFRRLTDGDNLAFDWPVWAMGGHQILYTVQGFAGREAEDGIYLMNADGSNPHRILATQGRLIQPKISPDGRSIIFVASWRDFPVVAIYRMDLDTMRVRNLTAVTTPELGIDSDVRWTPDGKGVLFVSGPVESGVVAQPRVFLIDADGGNRRAVTTDRSWYTDPMLSPDGRTVAISSYRGEGFPFPPELRGRYPVPYDWFLVLLDQATGSERVITQGRLCALRTPLDQPCSPEEGPAWIPVWSPDGGRIAFISVRRFDLTGIYVINADGTGARPLVEIPDLAIIWHDWTAAPGDIAASGGSFAAPSAPTSRLLYGAIVHPTRLDLAGNSWPDESGEGPFLPRMFAATPDRWESTEIGLPSSLGVVPASARWMPQRDGIVFTARVPLERMERPGAGPSTVVARAGGTRDVGGPADLNTPSVEEQIFLAKSDAGASDGSAVRQLTHPWIEDRVDGLSEGDLRANVEPDVAPDGRSVVFANMSTTRDESWILRQDLATGEIVNLTSMTCGLATCYDRAPRYAPDGGRIAFSSLVDGAMQLFVMDADGRNPRRETHDPRHNLDPAWSPDGTGLAYVRLSEATVPAEEAGGAWAIVALDLSSGEQRVLAQGDGTPTPRPVWSPDGTEVAYVTSAANGKPDIFVVPATGGAPRPLQVTTTSWELFVDWR